MSGGYEILDVKPFLTGFPHSTLPRVKVAGNLTGGHRGTPYNIEGNTDEVLKSGLDFVTKTLEQKKE